MEEKDKRKKKEKNGSVRDLLLVFRNVKLSWGFMVFSLVAMILQSLITLLIPDATANLFNGDFSTERLTGVVVTMVASFLVGVTAQLIRFYAEARSVRSARNSVWKMMMHVKSEYYSQHDPSSLLSIVTNDTQMLVNGLVQLFIFVPSFLVLLLGCVIAIGSYNKKLLLVILIMLPVYLFYMIFVGRWQFRVGKKIQIRIGELTGYLAERIRNLSMIKTFSSEAREEKNGLDAVDELYQVNREYKILGGVVNGYQYGTTGLSIVLAVLWGCYLLAQGEVSMTEWLAFFMYLPSVNMCFMVLSIIWAYVKDFQGRAFRLARLIEAPREDIREKKGFLEKEGKAKQEPSFGSLTLEHVDFGYGEERQILSDVSFEIPKGKITALVGPSGSGKTTVLKLLERLYDIDGGTILAGETKIQDLDLYTWRKHLSYVVQDAGVFGGTVRECMTYGLEKEVTEEQLEAVTKKVGMYEYIMSLPERFDTKLASWGSSMSGGQKQRLVIAREILRDADILFFDEPTSALDPEMAMEISRMIFNSFRGKTVVLVTHELNFISEADQIVVLRQGQVKGCGDHRTLMESCDVYRELVEEQSYQEVFA